MITEERQPEETDRWRFKMGDVGTMLGSITENQEGNSSVFFFCLSLFIGTLMDSQAFVILLVVKSRARGCACPAVGKEVGRCCRAWSAHTSPTQPPGQSGLCRK